MFGLMTRHVKEKAKTNWAKSPFIDSNGYTKGKYDRDGIFRVDWQGIPKTPQNLRFADLAERHHNSGVDC